VQARDVRAMEQEHAHGGGRDEDDHRPGLAERDRHDWQRHRSGHRGERRVAREREDRDPDHEPGEPHQRREPEEGACAGRDHLAAAPEAHENRPPVAEHRGAAHERADERALDLDGDQRRDEPLRYVEQDHRRAEPGPEAAPDVGGADVAAAELPDVASPEDPDDPEAEREAAGQVAGDDQDGGGYFGLIWYFATQSFTVAQSMLSKKASMYELRSVWKSRK
jgi:hypothetical protein